MLTKTRIGNHLRRHMLGDQPTFRHGFKEGVAFAQKHTSPSASKPWVGLTEEEIQPLLSQNRFAVFALARAIEAKLKEKNT